MNVIPSCKLRTPCIYAAVKSWGWALGKGSEYLGLALTISLQTNKKSFPREAPWNIVVTCSSGHLHQWCSKRHVGKDKHLTHFDLYEIQQNSGQIFVSSLSHFVAKLVSSHVTHCWENKAYDVGIKTYPVLYVNYISIKWRWGQKPHFKKTEVLCQNNQYILKCLSPFWLGIQRLSNFL